MTASETATLNATPTQIEGPYYKVASPNRASLIEPGMSGIKFQITGKMLTTEGKPVPGGVIDFWQSDDVGNYDMAGMLLRGHVFTDDDRRRMALYKRRVSLRAAAG